MQKSIVSMLGKPILQLAAKSSKKRSAAAAGIPEIEHTTKKQKTDGIEPKAIQKDDKHQEEESKAEQQAPITGDDPLVSLTSFKAALGDWQKPLQSHLDSASFSNLFSYVQKEYSEQVCYPPKELIFNAFTKARFQDLKVVIVGQDPYIKLNEAMGLSFSVPKVTKCPPSLQQIYHALVADEKVNFKMPTPLHGDLTNWASQGVMLLNAILTVRHGVSNSHQKQGWEQFSDEVIRAINKETKGVVFMLWGKKAHEKAKMLDAKKHLILCNVHPSPLAGSAFRSVKDFGKANEYLVSNGKKPVDWQL